MRYLILLFILSVLGGLSYFYLAQQDKVTIQEVQHIVGFELPDQNGKLHKLSELKGNWVIVHFWASWCAPCVNEVPELLKFAERWSADDKLRIVAISLDESWPDAAKIMMSDKLPSVMLSVLDAKSSVAAQFGTYKLPESFLLNTENKIVTKWTGPQKWNELMYKAIRSSVEKTK